LTSIRCQVAGAGHCAAADDLVDEAGRRRAREVDDVSTQASAIHGAKTLPIACAAFQPGEGVEVIAPGW
jgi:hypothetical protein